jgi:ribonuclease P protein component
VSDRQRPGERRERRGRLSRSAEFDRVYRQGRSHGNRFLVLYAFPREAGVEPEGAQLTAIRDDAGIDEDSVGDASEIEASDREEGLAAQSHDDASRRLGVSVSRKVGGAVERNKVKRLLREAFWATVGDVPPDHDFVVVARPDVSALAEREGLAGVQRELRELVEKVNPAASRRGQEEQK